MSLLNWKKVTFGRDNNTEEYVARDIRFLYRATRSRTSKSFSYQEMGGRPRNAPLRIEYYFLTVIDLKTMGQLNLQHHLVYPNQVMLHPNPLYSQDREPHHLNLREERFLPSKLVDGSVKLHTDKWMTIEEILNEMEEYLDNFGYLTTLRKEN